MDIDVLLVPFDSARRGERMGAGPDSLMKAGLADQLENRGHSVNRFVIEPPSGAWLAEIGTAFDLASAVAARVRAAVSASRFPLVLSGNCGSALGVVSGLGAQTTVIWADAHADFNTPETTGSGFLDGMALATLTGRCWRALAKQIPGFSPIPHENIWLVGARDLDPLESEALGRSAIRRVPAETFNAATVEEIVRQRQPGGQIYLHLDLDVLDPIEGRANGFAVDGGVTTSQLCDFFAALHRRAPPTAMTISAYDPVQDNDHRICHAALRIVDAVLNPD